MRLKLTILDKALASLELLIASMALVGALLCALGSMVARTFRIPTSEWLLELPMELLVVLAIFGSGAMLSSDRHLSVGIFVDKFLVRWRSGLATVVTFGLAVWCAFLAERSVTASVQAARAHIRVPELFNMPSALPTAIVACGLVFWCIHLTIRLVKR